jgi:NitT/TauT family transport system substrate-binding protein
MRISKKVIALGIVSMAIISACGGSDDGTATEETTSEAVTEEVTCETPDKVSVVLQWVTQSQFAGYYAAKDQGFWEDECLDVTIQEGGVNVVPQQVLASGATEFAVTHAIKTMAANEEGAGLVNIAQIMERGGYLQVSWADSGIKSLADLKGKNVGSWGYGNELILYAGMRLAGLDPEKDATIVQQPFDMSLLLNREIDAAQAKIYNEYAQLLEAVNPETGELYQPSDFTYVDFNKEGLVDLEDGIYARDEWLQDEANQDIAVRFIKGAIKGWAFCRDSFDACVDVVLANGPTLGKSHMQWQLNEINKMIWPSTNGIGVLDEAAWAQSVELGVTGGVLKAEPTGTPYRLDLAQKAIAALEGSVDMKGDSFAPQTVTLNEGGK